MKWLICLFLFSLMCVFIGGNMYFYYQMEPYNQMLLRGREAENFVNIPLREAEKEEDEEIQEKDKNSSKVKKESPSKHHKTHIFYYPVRCELCI